jgi:tetratricopeptide (TPR) repeat protein
MFNAMAHYAPRARRNLRRAPESAADAGICGVGRVVCYSADVTAITLVARFSIGLAVLASAACAGAARRAHQAEADEALAPESFYTVMAEIARARGEPRVAALQYAAAARFDAGLAPRAAQVAAESLQPSLALHAATQWLRTDPAAAEARHIAAQSALALDDIERSAENYRVLLSTSTSGTEAEFDKLDAELRTADNIFGARRLADRLTELFPTSAAALRLRGYAALRADDPAAAVRSFEAAGEGGRGDKAANEGAPGERTPGELAQALERARVLAGDVEPPLAQARDALQHDATAAKRFDYAMLLLAAKRTADARAQLADLARQPDSAPAANRLLALLDFEAGDWNAAGARFTELLTGGRDVEESFYYLGLIAERGGNFERALRLYARVERGDDLLPAMLRAAAILHAHGESPAADQLLTRLIEDQPDHAPEIWSARARLYADSGDLPQAIALLDRAIEQYPDDVDLRYARAEWYEEEGHVDASLRELERIAAARPADPAAWNALGYTLADNSRHLRRARSLIERAFAVAPKNAAILDSMGWVLYRQGHAGDALQYLTDAYANERGADIAAHLGEVLWRLGRRAEAERIFSEAGALDPEDRLLKATRNRLHATH